MQAHRAACKIKWKHPFNVFIESFSQTLQHFEPPHYNHSDGITKPKQAYGYVPEGAVSVLCWAACTHLLAHTRTHTFPRLNKCQIRSSQQEITSRSWGRSFLRANHPLYIPLAAAGSCLSTAHAHTDIHTHTHTCNTPIWQKYHMTEPGSFILGYDCMLQTNLQARLQRLSQKHLWNHRCEECNVKCVVFICAQVDSVPLNVLLGVLSVITLRSQLFLTASNRDMF